VNKSLPWFKLNCSEWIRSNLSGCSLAAQGLYLRMMIVAHDSKRLGYLIENNEPMKPERISRRCGSTPEEYAALFSELDLTGLLKRTPTGIIYFDDLLSQQRERDKERKKKQDQRAKAKGNVPEVVPPDVPTDVPTDVPAQSKELRVKSKSLKQSNTTTGSRTFGDAVFLKIKTPNPEHRDKFISLASWLLEQDPAFFSKDGSPDVEGTARQIDKWLDLVGSAGVVRAFDSMNRVSQASPTALRNVITGMAERQKSAA